jgi:hypothetical protein
VPANEAMLTKMNEKEKEKNGTSCNTYKLAYPADKAAEFHGQRKEKKKRKRESFLLFYFFKCSTIIFNPISNEL